jgi:hypothetical protein
MADMRVFVGCKALLAHVRQDSYPELLPASSPRQVSEKVNVHPITGHKGLEGK